MTERLFIMAEQTSEFPEIAAELLAMSERDQTMRKSGPWNTNVDEENTQRMKEIVAQIGWPTCSKVGKQAAFMAWLLVQHADHDREFQKYCLELMCAQPVDEVEPRNTAYLEDRVRVAEGRLQRYGTQFFTNSEGEYGPRAIEDLEHVDQRRAELDMDTLEEYTRTIKEFYQDKK
jgi:hypothetical protein